VVGNRRGDDGVEQDLDARRTGDGPARPPAAFVAHVANVLEEAREVLPTLPERVDLRDRRGDRDLLADLDVRA
jgi:hypothetical protein